ncbi:unnamed protein product [Phyllotreta striolata]|uniref:Uncharacterized protein n=1 Tax=Phyllotreta striolata TaxID=444603 RepID=A0A9N9XKC9_PHYSR|nr:unnamed protein product [Phyllotreta striolata]
MREGEVDSWPSETVEELETLEKVAATASLHECVVRSVLVYVRGTFDASFSILNTEFDDNPGRPKKIIKDLLDDIEIKERIKKRIKARI